MVFLFCVLQAELLSAGKRYVTILLLSSKYFLDKQKIQNTQLYYYNLIIFSFPVLSSKNVKAIYTKKNTNIHTKSQNL